MRECWPSPAQQRLSPSWSVSAQSQGQSNKSRTAPLQYTEVGNRVCMGGNITTAASHAITNTNTTTTTFTTTTSSTDCACHAPVITVFV